MSDQPLTHRRPARLRARALGVGGAAVAVAVGGLYYLSRGRKAEDEEPAPPALREPVVGDADPWEPYRPDRQSPWDQRRVVHLHRRAGFAATWDELQRDLRDGPEASVGRLLDGNARAAVAEGVAEDADRLAQLAAAAGNSDRLAASWVYRMLCGRDPLTEPPGPCSGTATSPRAPRRWGWRSTGRTRSSAVWPAPPSATSWVRWSGTRPSCCISTRRPTAATGRTRTWLAS